MNMRCVSLHQPWATLLCAGVKRAETRGRRWAPGRYLIHAAQSFKPYQREAALTEPFAAALARLGYERFRVSANPALWLGGTAGDPFMPGGAIVGAVTVDGSEHTEHVSFVPGGAFARVPWGGGWQFPADEFPFGDYSAGRFAMMCVRPVLFRAPVPERGQQGMWNIDFDEEGRG